MLAFYHRLANRLHRARHVLWALAAMCAIAFLAILFGIGGPTAERYLLPSVLVFTWLVGALSVTYGFRHPLPSAEQGASLLRRITVGAKRAYLWTMAALMSAVSVALGVLCLRAAAIILRG